MRRVYAHAYIHRGCEHPAQDLVLPVVKILRLVFFVLLLPTVISYVATVNGDPYNIASVMLFFALFIKFVTSIKTSADKRLKILLIASTVLLASAKLLSITLALLTIFIPATKFGGRKKKVQRINHQQTPCKAIPRVAYRFF